MRISAGSVANWKITAYFYPAVIIFGAWSVQPRWEITVLNAAMKLVRRSRSIND